MEMSIEERINDIEHKYMVTYRFLTLVTCKNNVAHHGYFQQFDDYTELKKLHKYRFIPVQNAIPFREENDRTGKLNKKYSIIINLADIEDIEQQTPEAD